MYSPMIHKAGTWVSTMTSYYGVMSQSATTWLQRIRVFIGSRASTFGVQSCHGIHALVPSMSRVIIATGLGPEG